MIEIVIKIDSIHTKDLEIKTDTMREADKIDTKIILGTEEIGVVIVIGVMATEEIDKEYKKIHISKKEEKYKK